MASPWANIYQQIFMKLNLQRKMKEIKIKANLRTPNN